MKEFSPNPMPEEVLRAYRNYTQLCPLLLSVVFTDRDREDVRDKFLAELIKKHADAEVFVGDKGRTQKVSARVKSFRRNVVSAVEFMLDVEDFGGREATMPILAGIMQPYWARWWESMVISPSWASDETGKCVDAMLCVLGQRQMLWIMAQYVWRLFYEMNEDSDDARLISRGAKQVEFVAANMKDKLGAEVSAWAVVQRAWLLPVMTRGPMVRALFALDAALLAARDIRSAGPVTIEFRKNIARCISASRSYGPDSDQRLYGLDQRCEVLDDIRKQLITPTLIINPSR